MVAKKNGRKLEAQREGTVVDQSSQMNLKRSHKVVQISPPTESPRHMTGIRFGKISSEIFCRNPTRREELGLHPLIVDDK